jgi:isoleucyl-tRNA synthetase
MEKKLGLTSKKDIETYGIARFNAECRQSVFEYISEWSRFTERIGYWVDLDDAYFTFDSAYIEAVWSIFKHVSDRDLLYKDYKVVPWCPRCGTGLSSHELGQPDAYQMDKDLSVYAKFKLTDFPNAYFLAWTTTPWTLPGNVALAVGEDLTYVEAKVGEEIFVLAKDRLGILDAEYEILAEHKGSEMAGMGYEPLYPYLKDNLPDEERPKLEKAFKIYTADFVTAEDGTGIVHTAVMYGQDDFELGTKVGLPKFHLVDDSGHFTRVVTAFAGRFVKDEETAVEIIKDLAHRGLLYKKEKHEHSYPHCWRCHTPLIYYARDSWYIRMSSLRDDLVAENERINWEPEYIKEGRFGDWLREVKDWAVSRERYWGTPMPVWESPSGKPLVVGSLEELREKVKTSNNTYYLMRHGGTESNRKEIVSYRNEASDPLTEEGRAEVLKSVESLKDKKIDTIIASPFARTRETAAIVAEALGIDETVYDERLREIDPGEFDGKSWFDYHEAVGREKDWFHMPVAGGESYQDVLRRVGAALYDIEREYSGKRILIVTHGGPAWLAYVATGMYAPDAAYREPDNSHETEIFVPGFKRMRNAEVRELDFVPMPHNENYELDLHRPYIDEIELEHDGEPYKRVKEVMDVWFDSGSVPFAQDAKDRKDPTDFSRIEYPADFISEAIDQTRGWFYTMHAIGVLMERGRAYKNVICLGHILDKDGKKMSKSLGNTIDPWAMIEKYGVDTLRLWMYSVNQPGEPKNFDERSVDEIQKRVFNLLDNVHSFYELYRDKDLESDKTPGSADILDQWILARLGEVAAASTMHLDEYRLLEPVRAIRELIDDLSTWWLRRSRERIKEGDPEAKRTLYHMLRSIALLLAPFAPFAAEDLYQKLRAGQMPASVHMCAWPQEEKPDERVLENMKEVRRLASLALEARNRAGIKIRQPLALLSVKTALPDEYLGLLKDEINVKDVEVNTQLADDVALDTALTPELEEEGRMRELVRSIQDLRKERGLKPGEMMEYEVRAEDETLFKKFGDEICRITSIRPGA